MSTKAKSGEKLVAENRKARHDFELGEKWECGLVLVGSEVKALREGNANLSDSYAMAKDDELYVHNLRIGEYKAAAMLGHVPLRDRKLLLHRAEIDKILRKVKERGFTLVPTKLYFKDGRAKLEIALASGKTGVDRRDTIKERDTKREIDRAMRGGKGRAR
ncbi:SsrA-binding protein SmpB [Vulgatibacter incomptus]|uniref:SsrA-binding protein n=1 Tax=Vulgatibacter incomptus TaxID=1391653 RepID=A0A0K1PE93_9BACT|nr:SsrA-binding protein SmpB [Vulgatibacter incomptus]AKU91817.1 tmRNA-binding protein SmpB [Vulgatibacter incomptus]